MLRIGWLAPLAAVLTIAACGGDDDTNGETTVSAGDADRYCELSRQLDAAGEDAFRKLEEDPGATQEDFAQAEEEFVRGHEAELDEIVEVAPEDIRADAQVLAEATRARAGLTEEPPDEQAAADAERNIRAFERQNCS